MGPQLECVSVVSQTSDVNVERDQAEVAEMCEKPACGRLVNPRIPIVEINADGTEKIVGDVIFEGVHPRIQDLAASENQRREISPPVDFPAVVSISGMDAQEETTGEDSLVWRGVSLASSLEENRLVVSASLNGIAASCMIDTGAATCIVSQHWLRENDISIDEKKELYLSGFGAASRIHIIGVVKLTVEIGSLQMETQRFYVSSCSLGAFSAILASDFLIANKFTVNLKSKSLRRSQMDGTIFDLYFKANRGNTTVVCRRIPCHSVSAVVLEPDQLSCIGVRPNEDNQALLAVLRSQEGSNLLFFESAERYGKPAYSGIMDVPAESFQIMLCNKGDRQLKLKSGEVVGHISSVVIVDSLSGEVNLIGEEYSDEDWKSKIDLEDHLTADQRGAILAMLRGDDRVQAFSMGDTEFGRLEVEKHHIELLDDTPIYQKPRRFPEHVSSEIERQCRELHLLDVIEPSRSPWSAPVVSVRKKDGTIRLCIDYRKLNAVTKPDRFPLPNLTDAVFSLSKMRWFSCLDLTRGYYQLPLDEASQEYTAFSTVHGHWQFKVLAFGLRNAPSAFQRAMLQVLAGFSRRNVIIYIDDLLIMTESFEEHLELVAKVLNTLVSYGVKVKLEKCKWFSKEVEYLGHVVGVDGVRKSASYLDKIRDYPRPTTVKELRAFLGLANWQRKFVPNFSTLQRPLSEKTVGRGHKKLRWTPEMEDAFQSLKIKILEESTLAYPDYSADAEPLELFVDASGVGAGACLAQKQADEFRVIAYSSTSFSSAETHYSTIERELTALRWGVQAFRPFLIGLPFVIHTDHQPLIYLQNMKLIDSRLARTFEDLSDFNYQIFYTPGKENIAADTLSRLYDPTTIHISDQVQWDPEKLPPGLCLLERVPGGGDSLLLSLQLLSQNMKLGSTAVESPQRLREILVDRLLSKPEDFQLKLSKDKRKALRLMRMPGQLPAVEVIYSFSRIFKCVVLVHYGGLQPVIYMAPCVAHADTLPRVHLQCLCGIHYNPVLETDRYEVPRLQMPHGKPKVIEETVLEEPIVTDLSQGLVMETSTVDSWCSSHPRLLFCSLMVSVQGKTACALFDTGAQVSCVAQSLVKQIGAHSVQEGILNLIGLGQGKSDVLGFVKLDVSFLDPGTLVEQASFAVVEDAVMPCCLIVGADVMEQFGITLNFSDGQYKVMTQGGNGHFAPLDASMVSGAVEHNVVNCLEARLPAQVRSICVGTEENNLKFGLTRGDDGEIQELTTLISLEQIQRLQRRSSQLTSLRRCLSRESSKWPKSLLRFRRYCKELVVVDGIVYLQIEGRLVYVVTFQFLIEVVLVLHYEMAHPGRDKLCDLVRHHIWHPSLAKVTKDVTRTCNLCQKLKVSSTVSPPLRKIRTTQPFELVAIDLVSLEPMGGFIGALVVMDHYTKWLAAVPIRSKTSSNIAAQLEQRVLPYLPRCPLTIITDNGPEFRGGPFKAVLSEFRIGHQLVTPNMPSSNGLVERANQTLMQLMRVQIAEGRSWVDALPKALIVHNATYHSSIGCSPSDKILRDSHALTEHIAITEEATEEWDEGHPSFVSFKVGQMVLKKAIHRGNLVTNKMSERFHGPYKVRQVNPNGVTYIIQVENGGSEIRAHHRQLRPYFEVPSYLASHPYFDKVRDVSFEEVGKEYEDGDSISVEPTFSLGWDAGADCITDSEMSTEMGTLTGESEENPDDTGYTGADIVPLWDVIRLLAGGSKENYRLTPEDLEEGVSLDEPEVALPTTIVAYWNYCGEGLRVLGYVGDPSGCGLCYGDA